jgi:putative membrane protein
MVGNQFVYCRLQQLWAAPGVVVDRGADRQPWGGRMDLLIIWLATTVSLLVISRIGLFGIEIEDFGTALVVAVALGLLNALLRPILNFLSFPFLFLTFGLFSVVINAVVFWLASGLVKGFELRRGCFSALIGPVALGLLNSIILAIVR